MRSVEEAANHEELKRLREPSNHDEINLKRLTDEEYEKIDSKQRESLKLFRFTVRNGIYSPSFDEIEVRDVVKAYIETRFLVGLKKQVDKIVTMTKDKRRKRRGHEQQSYLKSDLRCFDPDQFLFYWSPCVTEDGKIISTLKVTCRVDLVDKRVGIDWLDTLVDKIFMQYDCDIRSPYLNHPPIDYWDRSFNFCFQKLRPRDLEYYEGKSENYYLEQMRKNTLSTQGIDEIKAEIREEIQQQVAATMIQKLERGRKVRKNLPGRERAPQSNTSILSLQSICQELIHRHMGFKYEDPACEDDALLHNPSEFVERLQNKIQELDELSKYALPLKKTDTKICTSIKQHKIQNWFEYAMAMGEEPVIDLLVTNYGNDLLNGESIKFAILSGKIELFEKLLTKVRESQELSEQEWMGILDFAAACGDIGNFERICKENKLIPTDRALEMACVNSRHKMVQHLVREYGLNPNNKDLFILADRRSDDRMVDLLVRLSIESDKASHAARIIQNFWRSKGSVSCVKNLRLNLPNCRDHTTSREKELWAVEIQSLIRGKLVRARMEAEKNKKSEDCEKGQTETTSERSMISLNLFSEVQRDPRQAAAEDGPRM
ncbi:MAG: hypothetical protein VX737_06750 [Pseudomonadota bacterium]|nr:hypothetical protein [Pseudomonadota bacterium]